MEHKHEKLVRYILIIVVVIYGLYFSLYQIQRHRAFWTSIDLTNMEQTIWNTLHGDFMRSTVYPFTGQKIQDFNDRQTENRLGTHVQPLLLVLALPYALVPHPETFLVLMSVSVALGAIPFFRIARRRLDSDWWALACAIGYLMLPAVETSSGWDVHGTSFLPPLLLAALDAVESGKRGWWWFWTLLAMGCREDIPFLAGWAMFWLVPRERRREAIWMLGLGLGLSLFYFQIVIPHFGGSGTPFLAYFLPPGTEISPAGILPIVNQWAFWQHRLLLFVGYVVRLSLPLLFLYWLHLPTLLAMAPLLLINSLSLYPAAQFPNCWHYSVPIIPWALVGTVEGIVILEQFLGRWKPTVHWRGLIGEAVAVSILATHWMEGYTPLSQNFAWPIPTNREVAVERMLAQVPADASVSADPSLAAHLSQRRTLRLFPDQRDADWLIVDFWFGHDFYGHRFDAWREVLSDQRWETVAAHEGVILLRGGNGPPENVEPAFSPSADLPLSGLTAQFGEPGHGMHLVGVSVLSQPPFRFLCTRWIREGEIAFPHVIIRSSNKGIFFDGPLEVGRYLPELLSRPGSMQDCTEFAMAQHSSDASIYIFIKNEAGERSPVSLTDAGTWDGNVEVNDDALILHISGARQ